MSFFDTLVILQHGLLFVNSLDTSPTSWRVGGFGLAGSPPWLVGGGLVSELVVGRRVGGLAARAPWLPVRRSTLRRVTGEREDG